MSSPWGVFRGLVFTEDECAPLAGSYAAVLAGSFAPPPPDLLGYVEPYGFHRWQVARWSGKGRGYPTPLGPVPAPMGPALPQEGPIIGPSRLRAPVAWCYADGGPLVGCDGEAAAVLWCRHHPPRLHGSHRRPWQSVGIEYHRRRRARARRRR